MQDKLKILLEQLEINEESKQFFEGGSLERIKCNKTVMSYCFEITLKKLLPPNVAYSFLEKLHQTFESIGKVDATFKIEEIEENKIKEYYLYLLEKYSTDSPSLEILKDYKPEYKNEILTIVVGNKAEQMKLEELESYFLADLGKAGINISIVINVNSDINSEVEKEIEAERLASIHEKLLNRPEPAVEQAEESKKKFIPKDFKRKPLIQEPDNPDVIMVH